MLALLDRLQRRQSLLQQAGKGAGNLLRQEHLF